MIDFTMFLPELQGEDLTQVGGKGANLGKLHQLGFRVPAAFAVTTSAFDHFLHSQGMEKTITDHSARIDFKNLADVEAKTQVIRELMEQAKLPVEIAENIRAAYRRLTAGIDRPLVAVRSSVGTRDRARSSFPGQMDTYHNVQGEDEVLRLVQKCWASIWTARAASFREAMKIAHHNVYIAPLVQLMIPSETSGVIFTANPITGNRDELLINASYGLGEAVVSGTLSPDHYVVYKHTRKVLAGEVGNKCFQWICNPEAGQGNLRVDMPPEKSSLPCLTSAQIRDLIDLGLAIEKHYGEPQDIEWAYSGGELFVLQTRRITALEQVAKTSRLAEWFSEFDSLVGHPPDMYTSANISEVLPNVLTPATLSGLKPLDYGFWKVNHDLGLVTVPFPDDPNEYVFLGCFYGRAHLNLSAFHRLIDQIPGASAAEFDRPLPGDEERRPQPAKFSLHKLPFLAQVGYRALRQRLQLPAELKRQLSLAKERMAENRNLDFSQTPLSEFAVLADLNRNEGRDIMALHIANSQLAVFSYEMLQKFCRRYLGDENGSFTSRLVTGLTTLESAKPGFGIYRLYEIVKTSPSLTKLFQTSEAHAIQEKLRKSRSKDAASFREQLERFLHEYGYRAISEAELIYPSWEEDPSFVFAMIKNYLAAGQVDSPQVIEARQQADREAAVKDAHRRLGFIKRRILNHLLKETHTFVAGRENNKAVLMMGVHEVKRTVNEIGRRMLQAGLIQEKQDLYFLTMDEIMALCRGEAVDIAGLIPRRKEEYARNQTISLPETFRGHPRPALPESESLPEPAPRMLKGLPVSPGRVTGPARVILDPFKEAQIQPGEILVAPVTDAGWTPLFLVAKGLVVDVGGLLSHGSVVAREYGIPGVLNVMKATKLIKNGQIITVDGSRGEVYLHEKQGT